MKLYEVYKDVEKSKTWARFDEYLHNEGSISEVDADKIDELLNESNLLIFEAFGINPSENGKYFIAGSARLFKNPALLKVLNDLDKDFPLSVGDLDLVVPGDEQWKTLYNNYTNKDSKFIKKLGKKIGEKNIPIVIDRFEKQWQKENGKVYRPGKGKDGLGLSEKDIEAFTEWRPDLLKGAKDVNVRSTEEILSDSVKLGGRYYMSIYDIFDYKSQLGRKKEEAIVDLLKKFLNSSQTPEESELLFKNIKNILKK